MWCDNYFESLELRVNTIITQWLVQDITNLTRSSTHVVTHSSYHIVTRTRYHIEWLEEDITQWLVQDVTDLTRSSHHIVTRWSIYIYIYIYIGKEQGRIDWCCFYYFIRVSLVALLEVLCANKKEEFQPMKNNCGNSICGCRRSIKNGKFVKKRAQNSLGHSLGLVGTAPDSLVSST